MGAPYPYRGHLDRRLGTTGHQGSGKGGSYPARSGSCASRSSRSIGGTSAHLQVSRPCTLPRHRQISCVRLEGLWRNAPGFVEIGLFTAPSPKPMCASCRGSNIISVMAPLSLACMSTEKMAVAHYRRISKMGNCVTLVIFPPAAGAAPAPQQAR
jgi:hypothetical protein